MKSLTSSFIAPAATALVAMTLASAVELSDGDVKNLVERSYQYVAMHNVNNKFAHMAASLRSRLAIAGIPKKG